LKPIRLHILAFTLIRIVLSTTQRMIYPYLAVFGRGLGVDLAAMSLAVTLRSALGLFGPFLASASDSRGRKASLLLGLALYTAGVSLVVIWPTYPAFVCSMLLAMLGKYSFDPAMQAYLGDRVEYSRRARAMAVTELGWSLSFILGIPLVGFLIARRGWLAPFPLLALLGGLSFGLLAWLLPGDRSPARAASGFKQNLGRLFAYRPALAGLAVGMLISAANETVNLVFGVWLEDAFGLQIAALGFVAAVIGLSELGGETLAAGFTDFLGKPRAVGIGIVLSTLAGLALPFFGQSQAGATAGLFLFYIAFEFTLVSSLPLMTEILPGARATLMAANSAGHSLGRSAGALLASPLYDLGASGSGPGGLGGILFCSLAAAFINLLALAALHFLQKGLSGAAEGAK
jgi:predicted MFS family arabinose efflux permease